MTTHLLLSQNSSNLKELDDKSVNLIVTSPPYPMIEMWDEIFSEQDPTIKDALLAGNGNTAFFKMHDLLNAVWDECDRVLKDNGFACINIGDATRTIDGDFRLYSNHTRIIDYFLNKGYSVLPDIHWRKQSNSPNKFMGSGMYPAGAYVTYEHEYILIFRKGGKREFKGSQKELRQKSAFFWEERNIWFSDLWEIKGASQTIAKSKDTRERNASFPFEIPYRLINMYSAEGDTVLDPFTGLGTTNLAAMASNRNSIGVDIDSELLCLAVENMKKSKATLNSIIDNRISNHLRFIDSLSDEKTDKCYRNNHHDFLVKTRQEIEIAIDKIANIEITPNGCTCSYEPYTSPRSFEQLTIPM